MSIVANTSPTLIADQVRMLILICAKHITYVRGKQLQHHHNNDSSHSGDGSGDGSPQKDGSSHRSSQLHYDCSSEERILFQYISPNTNTLGQSLFQRQQQQQWYLHAIRVATKTVVVLNIIMTTGL